jgi:hypothetical protein
MNAWDPTPVATVAQFEDGLISMARSGIPPYGLEIFKAFAAAPAHTLTQQTLANALDCKKPYANRAIGDLSHTLADAMHFTPTSHYGPGDPRWWPLIAYSSSEVEDQWTIRPELLQALRNFSWVPQ